VALGIGAISVTVLTIDYGHLPYVALTLAASFGLYGLFKKRLSAPAADGLLAESGVIVLPAALYLVAMANQGQATFGQVSAGHTALLVLAGVVTAVPLLLFAGAANRIPLSAIGLLQYLTPIMQLGCGVLIFHEPMPPWRLVGFALVWIALGVFTWDGIRHLRATARAALPVVTPTAAAVAPATR
jgi:chloramphenicol-sensitive protein RarD